MISSSLPYDTDHPEYPFEIAPEQCVPADHRPRHGVARFDPQFYFPQGPQAHEQDRPGLRIPRGVLVGANPPQRNPFFPEDRSPKENGPQEEKRRSEDRTDPLVIWGLGTPEDCCASFDLDQSGAADLDCASYVADSGTALVCPCFFVRGSFLMIGSTGMQPTLEMLTLVCTAPASQPV